MGKVLFVSSDLGDNPTYCPVQFAGALRCLGHDTDLAGPSSGGIWSPLKADGLSARQLPSANPFAPSAMRAGVSAAARATLLYPFKAMPGSFGVALRLRDRLGIPIALHLDDWDGGFFADRSWGRRIWYGVRALGHQASEFYVRYYERRIREADVLTVSNRALQERFGGHIVRQGVDEIRFSPACFPRAEARQRLGISSETFLALFLGTPRQHKGLKVLAEAIHRLPAEARLLVVSSTAKWDGKAALEAAAGDKVDVRGPVPFGESGWPIAACDAFVIPQLAGTFAAHQLPAKLLMAMSLGAPLVTTEIADVEEALGGHEPAGLVVPERTAEAVEHALRQLYDDPTLGPRLGKEARRRAVERYGWGAMSGQLRQVLGDLVVD